MTLDQVEERLFALKDASRKHNKSISELPNFLSSAKEQLEKHQKISLDHSHLEKNIIQAELEYNKYAQSLSLIRKSKAQELVEKINSELTFLMMPDAQFFIEVNDALPSHSGINKISFMAKTNQGMKSGAIDKIASGGELSRFMLAVRVSLFDPNFKGLIIFDEIDTGLGGQVAARIGQRLATLGKINQVLVISHQPQVAALADNHYQVKKTVIAQQTRSVISKITTIERKKEIASMLSSGRITDISLAAAEELISEKKL